MQNDEIRGYKGAEVRTKRTFKYGRFEVRMKAAQPSGIVSSFFTFHEPTDMSKLDAEWNEIDIEYLGGRYGKIQFNAITPKPGDAKDSGPIHHAKLCSLNFSPFESFHNYCFEWRPTSVIWYVDEKEIYRIENKEIERLNKEQRIMLNIWNSAAPKWAGPMNTLNWEERAETYKASYVSIRVFEYDDVSKQFKNQSCFVEDFKDEKSFNDQWNKAEHTFSGNMSVFSPENIKLNSQNSGLELSVTKNYALNDLTRALHQAIIDGKDEDACQVLKHGADPNWKDGYTGSTALHKAAWKNNETLVKKLLEFGANPYLVKSNNQTAYDVAKDMSHKNVEKILYEAQRDLIQNFIVVDKQGANVEEVYNYLKYAARYARVFNGTTFESLSPNIQTDDDGSTPLHVAAWLGEKKVVEILIHCFHGDKSIKKKNGQTAEDVARDCKNDEIAEMLHKAPTYAHQ